MSSEVAIGRLMKGSEMFIKLVGIGPGPFRASTNSSLPKNHLAAAGTRLGLCARRLIGSSGFLTAGTILTRAT